MIAENIGLYAWFLVALKLFVRSFVWNENVNLKKKSAFSAPNNLDFTFLYQSHNLAHVHEVDTLRIEPLTFP